MPEENIKVTETVHSADEWNAQDYKLKNSHHVGNNLHRLNCWPLHTDPAHNHGL